MLDSAEAVRAAAPSPASQNGDSAAAAEKKPLEEEDEDSVASSANPGGSADSSEKPQALGGELRERASLVLRPRASRDEALKKIRETAQRRGESASSSVSLSCSDSSGSDWCASEESQDDAVSVDDEASTTNPRRDVEGPSSETPGALSAAASSQHQRRAFPAQSSVLQRRRQLTREMAREARRKLLAGSSQSAAKRHRAEEKASASGCLSAEESISASDSEEE